jgi:CBS domain-containing protein
VLIGQIIASKGAAVVTASSDATIADVVRVLKDKRIGAIVISSEDDQIDGIISERDITRGLADHGAALLDKKVRELMTSEVVTCGPDDGVEKLMQDMTSGRFRHMPVVQNGRLMGIISIGDVVKHRLHELETEAHMLQDYIAGGA